MEKGACPILNHPKMRIYFKRERNFFSPPASTSKDRREWGNKMSKIIKNSIQIVVLMMIAVCYTNCSNSMSTDTQSPSAQGQDPGNDESGNGDPQGGDQSLDYSFCDNKLDVTSGTLCAVKPSRLDANTKDIYGTATIQDKSFGFGYHVVAVPKTYRPDRGLWIHFTGTYGRPYDQSKTEYSTSTWLNEILEQGYVVIQIAYDNRYSINDTCMNGTGKNRNNCAGEARAEVLTGIDYTPLRTTDQYNSIEYRLEVLLTYLKSIANFPLPSTIQPQTFSWSDVKVSGHSQGGNQAYYIAKNFGVKFVCMLGSPYDVDDTVSPSTTPIADWFRVPGTATPVVNMGQFITKEDDNYTSFNQGAAYIGLVDGVQAFEASSPPYYNVKGETIDGHGASVGEPKFKSLRAAACKF